MSRFVAIAATILAVVFAVASLLLLLAGRHFIAGTLLTFVAFAIYFREINVE
ncbi:hypothetical protein [Natronococcus occultus]|uniref:Uncharacterized protein n=1 Tax=Natronococcus occultus SP4 TaxID=694430 RepID=L0JWT7_9EURY|nr:hypothetical protein [Natronococcus occultus]AGB37236.1 hypothetical protein Natoc_1425 [Natronococcus occultus SP4]